MKSHYSDAPIDSLPQRRTLSVLVDNEPGVLARIAGLLENTGQPAVFELEADCANDICV